MKRILLFLSVLLLAAISFGPAYQAAAASVNLINNSSAETATIANQPDSWAKGGWGTNTATHTYETNGHTGTRSLRVEITSYTNGDVKWYANPVSVTAAQSYTYSDWYKSSVSSDLVAQYQDVSGKYTYVWLGTLAANSSAWTQAQVTFTMPAGITKATIFHLIASKGWLQIDDVVLGLTQAVEPTPAPTPTPTPVPAPTPPPATGNIVPNPSFETANGANPVDWTAGAWGTNTATFNYLTTGQSGARSVKVEMSAYTNGDAKWAHTPQPVVAGKTYQFTDYYQSNTTTDVNIAVTMSDGTIKWYWLGTALPSASWQQFKAQFTVPAGAVSASVMHILHGVGWLTTDVYTFAPYTPSSFDRTLVSLTFDDAWRSIYTNGLPVMKKYGFVSTQYLLTGVSTYPDYMTVTMMKAFKNAGHEIASHTVDHYDLTTLSNSAMLYQLTQSKLWLKNNVGVTPTNFATPYGAYNADVIAGVKQNYRSHRSVETGYNSKDNFDIYNIRVQNITNTTTAQEVAAWVAKAKADKTWLVLVYHQVGNVADSDEYTTSVPMLDAHLAAIKASGVPVKTVQQALDEIVPQLSR